MGKSVGTHTVLVFKGVRFLGDGWWRIFPPGTQTGTKDATDQTSGAKTTMVIPALGVVYHSNGTKNTLEVVTQNAQGANKTFVFECSSGDEVYVERDVIHVPRPLAPRVRQPFDP